MMNTTLNITEGMTNAKWLKAPLIDWLNDRNRLLALVRKENRLLALVIDGADELDFKKADIEAIEIVIIEFADVMDGRGFSQAAMLREKFAFNGKIHGVNILEDNIPFMQKCGFDSFELNTGQIYSCETNHEERTPYSPVSFAEKLNRLRFD